VLTKALNGLHKGPFVDSLLAVALATVLIGFVVTIAGDNPIQVISLFACGGLGDLEAVYGSLMSSLPLIFSGLSLAIAFRAGLFNIGSEGQILIGGIAAALVGHFVNLGPFTLILMILTGAAAGFAWSLIPISIKLFRGAHEVIGCIMMNYIAINLCLFLVRGPFRAEASTEKTPAIVEGGWWPVLDKIGATEFSMALLFAMFCALVIWWVLFNRPFGFELRATGANPGAAKSSGIKVNKVILLSFGLSGALAGIGGATSVSGVFGSFNSQFSPGYGFDGITVALLGRNHPLGVVLAALLFGTMRNASKLLQWKADISPDIVFLFQGFIILALIAARPLRELISSKLKGGK
jgi:ABC-type uncharacterized transport system permease subunit